MKDQAGALRALVAERNARDQQDPFPGQEEEPLQQSRLIAVTSGKGGVGKSNFTLNLGIHWARQGKKVLMVDADMGMANADLLLGWTGKPHLGEFLAGLKPLDKIIQRHTSGLDVIVGLSGSRLIPATLEAHLPQCLKEIQALVGRYDVVLFDTGAGAGRVVTEFLAAAQEVVVVTNPEPTAMMDAYSLMKLVAAQGAGQRWYLLVNMALSEDEASTTAKSLIKAAGKFLGQDVSYLGWLPRDNEVLTAVRRQTPWVDGAPGSTVTRRLKELARSLDQNTPSDPRTTLNAFQRWLHLIRFRTLKGD